MKESIIILILLGLIGFPLVKLVSSVKPMSDVAVNAGLERLDTVQYLKLHSKFKFIGKEKDLGKYKSIKGIRLDGESFMVIMPSDYECKDGNEVELKIMW